MAMAIDSLNRLILFHICGLAFVLISQMPTYAQQGSYSTMAQRILDNNSSSTELDNLDVFKFSIEDILNSSGNIIENADGEPTIFGRTDYGSEFTLANDLDNSFSIEIQCRPSFRQHHNDQHYDYNYNHYYHNHDLHNFDYYHPRLWFW